MKIDGLLERVIPVLEKAGIPYMITGSVASSVHGESRSTNDLDVVIAPDANQLKQALSELQSLDFYADEMQASSALKNRSQFNAIDNASIWKVDFIFSEMTEYGRTELARRRTIALAGLAVQVASAEDVIIAKLRWSKLGGSARHIEDAAGILRMRARELDSVYIERWVREFQLETQWRTVKDSGS